VNDRNWEWSCWTTHAIGHIHKSMLLQGLQISWQWQASSPSHWPSSTMYRLLLLQSRQWPLTSWIRHTSGRPRCINCGPRLAMWPSHCQDSLHLHKSIPCSGSRIMLCKFLILCLSNIDAPVRFQSTTTWNPNRSLCNCHKSFDSWYCLIYSLK
jgi:hypothetical protein